MVLKLLSFYKKQISLPLEKTFGHACRFTPTCSEYAYDAIKKYGISEGGLMGVKRVLRCQPFSKGGYDPVK